jgi:hypothetical protein
VLREAWEAILESREAERAQHERAATLVDRRLRELVRGQPPADRNAAEVDDVTDEEADRPA